MADGDDCKCCACCIGYCSCGADWTSQEVYDLMNKVSQLQTEVEELQKANSELLKRVLVLTDDSAFDKLSISQHMEIEENMAKAEQDNGREG